MPSCATIFDGVFIGVYDIEPPTDQEWQLALDLVREHVSEIRCGLIVTDGGGPNAHQRKALDEQLMHQRATPRAVVTSSAVARGIVTATSWLGHRLKAFSPDQLSLAFEFLEVPIERRAALMEQVRKLRVELHESRRASEGRQAAKGGPKGKTDKKRSPP